MMENKYLRIGTDYFKKVEVPLHSGDTYKTLHKWKKSEIITDEGRKTIKELPKFDGFCLIPSHANYQSVINNFYNKYEALDLTYEKGKFPYTINFLEHIFGEQYELGLDYITILWHNPTQILPVLCLVSEERKTGKTTFLNWLKMIFQGNMTINKNEDFRSRFNADWASKLIISVDEVLLDKKEDSERIKNLSTANTYKTESKGIDKIETPFFGKFILCSNNETSFIYVDKNEIRYWVRKVPSIADENENPNFLLKLKSELPYFMYHIKNRMILTPKKTRAWFSKEQINTEALSNLVVGNKAYINSEIEEILKDNFIKYEKEQLKYSLSDLVELLSKNNIRTTSAKLSEILKTHYKLESTNGMYSRFYANINPMSGEQYLDETKHKGRYFTFEKKNFLPNES